MKSKKFRKSGQNPIKNFIRVWRRDGIKGAWKQFQLRFYEQQTPERLLNQEIFGFVGVLCCLVFATILMLLRGVWYLLGIFLFSSWISYVNLKGKLKQRKVLKEIKEIINVKEADKNGA